MRVGEFVTKGAGVGALTGIALSAGLYHIDRYYSEADQTRFDAVLDEVNWARNEVAEELDRLGALEEAVGIACLQAIDGHRVDERISDNELYSLVSDVLEAPEQPCGTTRTVVEESVLSINATDIRLDNRTAYLRYYEDQLMVHPAEANPSKPLAIFAIFTPLMTAVGALAGKIMTSSKKIGKET